MFVIINMVESVFQAQSLQATQPQDACVIIKNDSSNVGKLKPTLLLVLVVISMSMFQR